MIELTIPQLVLEGIEIRRDLIFDMGSHYLTRNAIRLRLRDRRLPRLFDLCLFLIVKMCLLFHFIRKFSIDQDFIFVLWPALFLFFLYY